MSEETPEPSKLAPRAIRDSIKKTIEYILKNGPEFEQKLISNDKNGLFGFLDPKHEFHSTYQRLLERCRKEKKKNPETSHNQVNSNTESRKKPIDLSFIRGMPIINHKDVKIIRLTAQAVATNGEKYAKGFLRHAERSGRGKQFAFLRPNHTYYPLYQNYRDWYQGLIDFSSGAGSQLEQKIVDALNTTEDEMLSRSYDRAAYEKANKISQQDQEVERIRRQEDYASIDWQDFVPVARVNFDAIDEVSELAAPLSMEEVMSRSLADRSTTLDLNQRLSTKSVSISERTYPEDGEENEKDEPTLASPALQLNNGNATNGSVHQPPKGMKIKAAGETRLKRKQQAPKESTLLCPFTGQNIPEAMFDSHLRTILRDPRYQEHQENYMRKNFTYASNLTSEQVYENIKNLVRRPGQSEEEEIVRIKRSKLNE